MVFESVQLVFRTVRALLFLSFRMPFRVVRPVPAPRDPLDGGASMIGSKSNNKWRLDRSLSPNKSRHSDKSPRASNEFA